MYSVQSRVLLQLIYPVYVCACVCECECVSVREAEITNVCLKQLYSRLLSSTKKLLMRYDEFDERLIDAAWMLRWLSFYLKMTT
jgi:hypothetical protein